MSSLASLTKRQWTIIIALLALNVLCLYAGVIPAVLSITLFAETPTLSETAPEPPNDLALADESPLTPTPTARPSSTRTPTRLPSPAPTAATPIPTATSTHVPSATPTRAPAPRMLAPQTLAELELDPRAALSRKTTFFTSACFGEGVNLLQDLDYMAPADWSSSPDRKCLFGYRVNPLDGMPTGRYSVFGVGGQPRFYLIPPEAFAPESAPIKQLSQMHLIVDPTQGCGALGALGITADGKTYQCPACAFLRAGGTCLATDNSKSILLPNNPNYLLEPDITGGAYGFQNFPLILFRHGFSLYFTGRGGYAPPRLYFESVVDTLNVNAKTTAEMTQQDLREFVAPFDRATSGDPPSRRLASLEQELSASSTAPIAIRSREQGSISFTVTPGTLLSSIVWRIKPLNNVDNRQFLETNLCLTLNGEPVCFTGVEDFAHCAFYTPCQTGYSSLTPTDGGGYLATRYFLPGAAPVLRDKTITAKFQAPDVGAVLEIDVKLRVRRADPNAR